MQPNDWKLPSTCEVPEMGERPLGRCLSGGLPQSVMIESYPSSGLQTENRSPVTPNLGTAYNI